MMITTRTLAPLKLFAASAIILASSAVFSQNAVYRWTGEDGIVHYGATPPLGVEAELVKAGGPSVGNPNPAAPASAAGTPADGTAPEQAAAEPQPELSPEMQARKAEMCKEERQRLATLQKPGRIRMAQPDGSTKYLSIEEIQAEIDVSNEVIRDACN